MWSEKNETDFQQLVEKFKKDPHEKIEAEELELIKNLMKAYVYAEAIPFAEVPFYQKLTEFFNIFLEAHHKANPNMLNDKESLHRSRLIMVEGKCRLKAIAKSFLIFQPCEDFIQQAFGELPKVAEAAYLSLVAQPVGDLFGKALEYVSPADKKNHPYENPELDPENGIANKAYHQMLQDLYDEAEKAHGQKLGREQEVIALTSAYYHARRATGLTTLLDMYCNLHIPNFVYRENMIFSVKPSLKDIPHVCYSNKLQDHIFYKHAKVRDILPHFIFEKIAQIGFNSDFYCAALMSCRGEEVKFLAYLVGKILTENHKSFIGFTLERKLIGRDPGFLLVSPDRKTTYYGKSTAELTIPEYFCGRVLTQMGIKMPESQLLLDEYGNRFTLTRDVSRQYTKGEDPLPKVKEFVTFKDLFEKTAPQAALKFDREPQHPPLAEQQKPVEEFLQMFRNSSEARVSFAKLIMAQAFFGIKDVFKHGGNVGIIKVTKGAKHYQKLGIVDFDFQPEKLQLYGADSAWNYVFSHKQEVTIFMKMHACLTKEDMKQAAYEFAFPKIRAYSKEDFLLVQAPVKQTKTEEVINYVYREVVSELREKLPAKQFDDLHVKLAEHCKVMEHNLGYIRSMLLTRAEEQAQHEKAAMKAKSH